MDRTRIHEGIRQMRFERLLDRQESGGLSQVEAAELLGISERSFRRWRDRLRDEGAVGLADRRLGKRSPRRASVAEISRMLRDSVAHAAEDIAARALTEARVEAELLRAGNLNYAVHRRSD